jgi:hypothetical protein
MFRAHEIKHTAALGSQAPNCERLPAKNIFSPNTVCAVSAKLIATVELPEPFCPVWIAIALRAGTDAVKLPPETVNLGQKHEDPSDTKKNIRK